MDSTTCYIMQIVQRYDGCTKISPISVHKNKRMAINKFVTIILNFIDELQNDPEASLDSFLEAEDDIVVRNEVRDDINNAVDINEYIKWYIGENNEELIDEFSFLSDEREELPEVVNLFACDNEELRLCDDDNNICEIGHGEYTLSLMKSTLE